MKNNLLIGLMICNNIITKHIALIILRNGILVIIVIDFEMCFKTSEKITLRMKSEKNYHFCKVLFNPRKIQIFEYISRKTCS
jgi:hypothetical protein